MSAHLYYSSKPLEMPSQTPWIGSKYDTNQPDPNTFWASGCLLKDRNSFDFEDFCIAVAEMLPVVTSEVSLLHQILNK